MKRKMMRRKRFERHRSWGPHSLTISRLDSQQLSTATTTLPSREDGYTQNTSTDRSPSTRAEMHNGAPSPAALRWNPAMLLNPRGFHESPQQNGNSQFTNSNTLATPAFQFESVGGSSAPPSRTLTPQPSGRQSPSSDSMQTSYSSGESQGMSHMLERMHNLTDREHVPQKRRKIREDQPEERLKATFDGGGQGGVLGEYMREKRLEGQKEATARGTVPVEISTVDDEVEVVGTIGDKEVCYGRIEGTEINAHKVPTARAGSHAMSDGFWPQVKIVLRRRVGEKTTVIYAVDSTREIIGCVDVSTSIGLAPLLDTTFGIRTASRILTRAKRDMDLPPGSATSTRYSLDLNLYGPKKYALQIGRHLSQKQIWLRTPLFVDAGVELYNPHAIEKPPAPARTLVGLYGSHKQGPVRTTEEIRNDVLGMFDSLLLSENLPEREPDLRITTELLRHQKQGLYFMTQKEKERVFGTDEKGNSSLWRLNIGANGQKTYYNVITGHEERRNPPQVLGGILADMMGLGKTLSILSLIVSALDDSSEWAKQAPKPEERVSCHQEQKGKKALPAVQQSPLKLNAKTTLLVSPLSTIVNWEEQITQHVKPGTLKYYVYHGAGRIKDAKKLAEYDLVITTYGSVASEFNFRSKKREGVYPLEEINWFRIVLDEAHMIREQSTQQSKAICRLAASRRWAVTGTPVQNRLEDLGALMFFLRVKPFDEKGAFAQYIMAPFKMCDPEILPKLRLLVDSITIRRLKDRIDLPPRSDHIVKLDFSQEERTLYEIFAKNASDRVKVIVGQREKSLGGKSYVHILQSILRLRLICAHGRDLLDVEDLQVMEGLSRDSAIDLDGDDDVEKLGLTAKQAHDMFGLMKETNADICLICGNKAGPKDGFDTEGETKDEIIGYMTPCYHIICPTCIDRYKSYLEDVTQGQPYASCPICQQQIRISYFPLQQGVMDDEEDFRASAKAPVKRGKRTEDYSGPHTKTKALTHDLLASKQESELKPLEPPIKSVVFSGWTAHLDLIQLALEENGIKYTRLDGKMSRPARGAALDAFRDNPSILVILVSITAGGLGLNLTTANKVYVMEPQYNPAAEAQAVDRVHRLGQKRPVETVRYIMRDSFEEKMLELQEKKKKLASLSMDSEGGGRMMVDKAEAARKRLEDLRSLFR